MMPDPKYKIVEASSLKMADGAKELLESPDMEPYGRHIEALMFSGDADAVKQEIAALPLNKRYVWRVASAMKWALVDFDSWNVVVDRQTLSPDDAALLKDLLKLRPIQFCMFFKALVGVDEMERLMKIGIQAAKDDDG